MAARAKLITGDDAVVAVDLTLNGAAYVVDPSAVVKAALIDVAHTQLLTSVATIASTDTGNDWPAGRVGVPFAGSETATLAAGLYKIEIEVTVGGVKKTWHAELGVARGLIS